VTQDRTTTPNIQNLNSIPKSMINRQHESDHHRRIVSFGKNENMIKGIRDNHDTLKGTLQNHSRDRLENRASELSSPHKHESLMIKKSKFQV